jgi:hypothetical protein
MTTSMKVQKVVPQHIIRYIYVIVITYIYMYEEMCVASSPHISYD